LTASISLDGNGKIMSITKQPVCVKNRKGVWVKMLREHPHLIKQLADLCETRRNEILADMLEKDEKYKNLCKIRKDNSIALKRAIHGTEIDSLFENYADASFSQDAYELDSLYRQGMEDTLSLLATNGII
jgi:hypothetical protein